MDPVPAAVRKLWNTWDVRVLVLLSLTLQTILFIFGKRRKYMASLWINVVVWLAYLMADWVATVALGKLSDAQEDHDSSNAAGLNMNAIRAIWAPLLLLHLGGPDTITAYSMEDNDLWMRHLLGMGTQAFVVIYVILMSWTKSWFSFFLFPALVAGIIKYGERTWALKSISDDNSGDIIPLDNLGEYHVGYTTTVEKYVNALIVAHKLVKRFKSYMENYDVQRVDFEYWDFEKFIGNDADFLETVEVEMGLMYDILHTKAALTYTKWACFLRSISFVCTMSVLLRFFWLIFTKEKWHKHYSSSMGIEIAITGVLLVGALALEIYAVPVLLFSNWALLFLIKQNRVKWVIQLGQKFPWLFLMLGKKNWSKVMGQFDLLDFYLKEDKLDTKLSSLLGVIGIQEKFKRYRHTTYVDVPSDLYGMIFEFLHFIAGNNVSRTHKFDEIQSQLLSILNHAEFFEALFVQQIVVWHIVTEICYHWESNTNSQNSNDSSGHHSVNQTYKETTKMLSHYMMYILLNYPSLLPFAVSDARMRSIFNDFKQMLGNNVQDVSKACQMLENIDAGLVSRIVSDLKVEEKSKRWTMLNFMWLRMLFFSAWLSPQTIHHLQQLRQGGQLLTLLWFIIPQSIFLAGIDPRTIRFPVK